MDSDRQFSDLAMSREECPKCGAVWMNGQHYWSGTGSKGNDLDLAGLVCNNHGDERCINPSRGKEGGDTWEKRLDDLDAFARKHGEGKSQWWDKE